MDCARGVVQRRANPTILLALNCCPNIEQHFVSHRLPSHQTLFYIKRIRCIRVDKKIKNSQARRACEKIDFTLRNFAGIEGFCPVWRIISQARRGTACRARDASRISQRAQHAVPLQKRILYGFFLNVGPLDPAFLDARKPFKNQ